MSITIEHLIKRYEGRPVVNDVSLAVAEGELFVLLGPSGSGKSTILRMIAGLTPVDSGRILLRGEDVTRTPPQARATGFVFQHYALFPHMTVADNVEFGLRVQRTPSTECRRRREELLELVGLSGLGNRLPRQLSGGQQQRVALARALAPRPSVLLLDEPFGALDARIRVELRRALQAIQREVGITTIFVTHDQEEAFDLGDRLGVMNLGRLLEVGPPSELYLRPETEFAATFLGSANLVVGTTTRNGVEVGPIRFPATLQEPATFAPRPVQVLFRPEDVALAPDAQMLADPPLGRGEVELSVFVGACERLWLRLPPIPGVRPIAPAPPFGGDAVVIEAMRTQDQARRFPLAPGDAAWIGVRRVHALAQPGLSLLLVTDGSPAGQAALEFGARMAQRIHGRGVALGVGVTRPQVEALVADVSARIENPPALEPGASPDAPAIAIPGAVERAAYDLIVLTRGSGDASETVQRLLDAGKHHVLLAPRGGATLPTSALICVAGTEPSKEDALFAGHLCQQLGAAITLLTVQTDDTARQGDPARAQRFLDAAVRSLALLAIPATTLVRAGPLVDIITGEMATGKYGMLVLGAPLHPLSSARIRAFVVNESDYPVLIVRSVYAEPWALAPRDATANGQGEEMVS